MTGVPVEQKAFVCKDLFSFGLTYAMPLLALSGVAVIPLESDYVAKVNCWTHLQIRLQAMAQGFNSGQ